MVCLTAIVSALIFCRPLYSYSVFSCWSSLRLCVPSSSRARSCSFVLVRALPCSFVLFCALPCSFVLFCALPCSFVLFCALPCSFVLFCARSCSFVLFRACFSVLFRARSNACTCDCTWASACVSASAYVFDCVRIRSRVQALTNNIFQVFGFLSWILFAVDLLFFLRHYGSIDGRVARIRVQHLSPGDAGNDDELDVWSGPH